MWDSVLDAASASPVRVSWFDESATLGAFSSRAAPPDIPQCSVSFARCWLWMMTITVLSYLHSLSRLRAFVQL